MDLSYACVRILTLLVCSVVEAACDYLIEVDCMPWSKFKPGSSHADLLRLVSLQASIRDFEQQKKRNTSTCSTTPEHI